MVERIPKQAVGLTRHASSHPRPQAANQEISPGDTRASDMRGPNSFSGWLKLPKSKNTQPFLGAHRRRHSVRAPDREKNGFAQLSFRRSIELSVTRHEGVQKNAQNKSSWRTFVGASRRCWTTGSGGTCLGPQSLCQASTAFKKEPAVPYVATSAGAPDTTCQIIEALTPNPNTVGAVHPNAWRTPRGVDTTDFSGAFAACSMDCSSILDCGGPGPTAGGTASSAFGQRGRVAATDGHSNA